jgi:ATP-dependent Clp protease ATP-binding subunit ClpC
VTKALLVREGYNPAYGARPLRRTVQRLVETPLSRSLLKGEFKPGDIIMVDVAGGALTFSKRELLELGEKKPAEPLGA